MHKCDLTFEKKKSLKQTPTADAITRLTCKYLHLWIGWSKMNENLE